ncbi:UDP-N-acetylglucosamine transporter isoform X3 [Diorhabda carinulata]|uniref:UDP-N-acetylglucosamine transporter isoform X3 n=1 Tax=Diorhabda carinulata TaxID=1163345 RepID=UPI0025A1DE8A|nr:UDP-N-acetylglucosamine transporter isoform X3 [Diorhabda carinulata]
MVKELRLRKTPPLTSSAASTEKSSDSIKMQKKSETNSTLKYISLITLTLQNAVLGLSMRYARTREGDMFLSSTAVLMAEVVKLATCIVIVYVEAGGVVKLFYTIDQQIIKQPTDTLKICVPSFVYLVQNNLLYLSASHLDAATYQLAQSDDKKIITNGIEQNHFVGFMAAFAACCLSGFAGVYFEKMLKGSDVTVWIRNVQLSFCSIPFGLISCFLYDGGVIRENGFFFGYDKFVWYLVVLQATGGLIVAIVVKYADNILKGFATSLAIVISCIVSMYIFDFELSLQFALGAGFVIFSIFLYGYVPKKPDISLTYKV